MASFTLTQDQISPSLAGLAEPSLRARVLKGMGTVVMSNAQRAFDEPALRPAAWPKRKGGSNPLMIRSGDLRQGIHMQVVGETVVVGSPAKYAAVHQLGATITPTDGRHLHFKIGDRWVRKKQVTIPARPFFPFDKRGQLTGNAKQEIQDVVDALIGGAAGQAG
jgi:phage gpG-like protein